MRVPAAVVLAVAFAALSGQTHGKAVNVIGLSGDDTRHGVITLYGAYRSNQEIEVTRYHVDTLVQTRFAHTVVDVEIRNNGLNGERNITVPFAIPTNAMLTQFIVETAGKEFQARPVLREEINVVYASSSATIKARDTESFDVSMELLQGGVMTLRLEYEELLTRHLQRYKNVQQIWPGSVVKDMRISVRVKEATNIVDDVTHSVTTETASGPVVTLDAQALAQMTTVSKLMSASRGGVKEVSVTLKPTEQQQRDVAKLLSAQPEQGIGGQFNVEYEVERYPHAGDIVVSDGYFAHFFAPSNLTALPKYALFLLDVSGSMRGIKIEQLRDAMNVILGQLGPDDIFTVIEFSDRNNVWQLSAASQSSNPDCLAYGADAVAEAQQRTTQMAAQGGTALLGGIELALDCAKDTPVGREPLLVVLTDGAPNEPIETILSSTSTWNGAANGSLHTSLFTLAFGEDANLVFLKELAARNGGSSRQIYTASDASMQLQDFYASIASPLLRDVSVTFDYQQADQATVTQEDFRTYFWGAELVVAGKLLPGSGDSLTGTVTAMGAGGKVSYPIKVSAQPEWQPERLRGVPNSERLWAFLRTSQQLDQAALDGHQSPTAKEAIKLALEHSFVTPYTCLALDVINPYQAPTTDAPTTTSTAAPTTTSTAAPTTTSTAAPTTTSTAAPTTTSTAAPTTTSTARPRPPPPPPTSPAPRPPRPSDDGQGIRNEVNVGTINIGTLSVNGPLLQFNLR